MRHRFAIPTRAHIHVSGRSPAPAGPRCVTATDTKNRCDMTRGCSALLPVVAFSSRTESTFSVSKHSRSTSTIGTREAYLRVRASVHSCGCQSSPPAVPTRSANGRWSSAPIARGSGDIAIGLSTPTRTTRRAKPQVPGSMACGIWSSPHCPFGLTSREGNDEVKPQARHGERTVADVVGGGP